MAFINASIAPQFIYLGRAFLFVCAGVIVAFINTTISHE